MKKLSTILLLLCIVGTSTTQQNEFSKKQAIKFIKSYYANFKTGSYEYAKKDGYPAKGEVMKYRQYTGNYKVKIEGCQCKIYFDEITWPHDCTTTIDYDIYNWADPKRKDRKTIEFNFSEIDSIGSGNKELGESEVINWNMRFHSFKSIKITNVPIIRDRFSGKGKYLFDLKINAESKENADFSNIEIVKAFRRLISLCKTQ